jgi:hypothetical protein
MVSRHGKRGAALREKIRYVILPHPLADGLHPVDEGREFVDGRITPGGIDTDIP